MSNNFPLSLSLRQLGLLELYRPVDRGHVVEIRRRGGGLVQGFALKGSFPILSPLRDTAS